MEIDKRSNIEHHVKQAATLAITTVHDPGSRNCAMLSAIFVHNINSSKLHFQSVALRSQYSDHVLEAVTLH